MKLGKTEGRHEGQISNFYFLISTFRERLPESFDGDIDLALFDIKLLDMEGGKVYPFIIKARPDLMVIVFSGFTIEGPKIGISDNFFSFT